jgi:hypothetical protein
MQLWKEEGQIWSGAALHTWRLVKDYEELTADWPADKRHEVTLWLCSLQNLLTVCTELIESLHKHKSLVMRALDERMSRVPWNFGGGPIAQATFTRSSCTRGPTVSRTSRSSAARSAGRCRWPLTRRNCLPARPSLRRTSAAPSDRRASA